MYQKILSNICVVQKPVLTTIQTPQKPNVPANNQCQEWVSIDNLAETEQKTLPMQ